MNKLYKYFRNCVEWPRNDVYREGGLVDMIDEAITISRRTFLRHVSRIELENIEWNLGYVTGRTRGMKMADDYCVSYHRSKLHGKRVYFFTQSATEYVFTGVS